MVDLEGIQRRYAALGPLLDERLTRLWAAAEAQAAGYGGISLVARATGITRKRIAAGLQEVSSSPGGPIPPAAAPPRVRRPGGGSKPLTERDPALWPALEALVDPVTRGDPQSPLRWTCKSTAPLALALQQQGHPVSARTVAALLKAHDYSLQGTRKTQ